MSDESIQRMSKEDREAMGAELDTVVSSLKKIIEIGRKYEPESTWAIEDLVKNFRDMAREVKGD